MSDLLPPVAKSIFVDCKKCEAERWHKVLAHTTETSAKLQCEVCGAKKTYSLPKAGAKPKKPRKTGEGVISRSRSAHNDEYQSLLSDYSKADISAYNMRMKFDVKGKLEHPKFGIGVIRSVVGDRIEVVFSDEVRMLVHNRG